MLRILYVAVGGGAGAVCRYLVSVWVAEQGLRVFPWGTFAVNIAGSFLLGFLYELSRILVVPPEVRMVLAVGFLGAFTTFSTFSLETVNLLRDGEIRIAAANIGISVFLGLAAVAFGFYAVRLVFGAAE
jgi:CrcB protein